MTVISDKQGLRRCLKQYMRNLPVVESCLDWNRKEENTSALFLQKLAPILSSRPKTSLLTDDECACLSAVKKLGFSGETKDELTRSLSLYSNDAWLREVLEAGSFRRVYVPVRLSEAETVRSEERLQPFLCVGKSDFVPGRYGIEYRAIADQIRSALRLSGCRHLSLTEFDEEALKYCILPVCEEEGAVLRVFLNTAKETEAFFALVANAGYLHAILRTTPDLQPALIRRLEGRDRFLLSLNGFQDLALAFSVLRLRFIPYESRAESPETMLGKWIMAREQIWPALLDAYLPTARTGLTLTAENLEEDLSLFLGGYLLQWD